MMILMRKIKKNALYCRDSILKSCDNHGEKVGKLIQLPKPLKWLFDDNIFIEKLKIELEGVNYGIKIIDVELGEYSDQIKSLSNKLIDIRKDISNKEKEIKTKDSEDFQLIRTINFHDTWRWFSLAKKDFDLVYEYPIKHIQLTQGTIRYKVNEDKIKTGEIIQNWPWQSLNSFMSVYTFKKHYFEKEIILLKERLSEQEENENKYEDSINNFAKNKKVKENELRVLKQKYSLNTDKIKELSRDSLSMEEIQQRLEIQQKEDKQKLQIKKKRR